MAFGRKEYGSSQTASCIFCGAAAYSKNTQGFLVCSTHKTIQVGSCKCICGQWLDERDGKYGRFFSCVRCGAMNLRRVKEMNPDAFKVTLLSAPPVAKEQSYKLSIYQS